MAVTSSMTVAQARTRAQAYLDAPGATDISTAQWLLFAQDAINEVHRKIIDVNPDHFTNTTMVTIPGGEGFVAVSGTGAINDDMYRIVGIDAYQTLTPTPGVDQGLRLTPIRFADLSKYRRMQGSVWRDDGTVETPIYYTTTGSTTALRLYVAPVPTADCYLAVQWVESPAQVTGDSSVLSVPLEYEIAVVRRMASLANIRTGGRNQAIEQAWRDALADIEATAGPKVDDDPRQMHVFGDGW